MPPNVIKHDIPTAEVEDEGLAKLVAPQAGPRQYQIIWSRLTAWICLHIAALYGLYLMRYSTSWRTILYTCFTFYLSAVAVCAGAHRLWSHRSYKATKPLQLFIMLCYCLSFQYTIFSWVKDHRLHHRYSDTDGDPYNASRGFVYSHIGWTVVDRHSEVRKRSRLVDMSDITANPIVMFQKRHVDAMNLVFGIILPTLIPIYFWNESCTTAFHVNILRIILSVYGTFSINSFAHMFGTRPYDKNISPTQNILTNMLTFGEGFHNYHHTFPYDYKAGEFGQFLNFSASFIAFCGKLGLAYDLKEVSKEVLQQRMARTGDGTDDKYGLSFVEDIISSSKA